MLPLLTISVFNTTASVTDDESTDNILAKR